MRLIDLIDSITIWSKYFKKLKDFRIDETDVKETKINQEPMLKTNLN